MCHSFPYSITPPAVDLQFSFPLFMPQLDILYRETVHDIHCSRPGTARQWVSDTHPDEGEDALLTYGLIALLTQKNIHMHTFTYKSIQIHTYNGSLTYIVHRKLSVSAYIKHTFTYISIQYEETVGLTTYLFCKHRFQERFSYHILCDSFQVLSG